MTRERATTRTLPTGEIVPVPENNVENIFCSNCRKGLVSVWIVQPGAAPEHKLKARCCYCGDWSFLKVVTGKIRLGGFVEESQDGREYTEKTRLGNPEFAEDYCIVPTTKT